MHHSRDTTSRTPKETPIKTYISLREAGRRLGLNSHYVKGMAEALGVVLIDSPPSLLMSIEDFGRLQRHRENILKPSSELASLA